MGIDVCLVSPPKRAYNHHRPPLALMLLASALEKMASGQRLLIPSLKWMSPTSSKNIVENILTQLEENIFTNRGSF